LRDRTRIEKSAIDVRARRVYAATMRVEFTLEH
jgi:hypothetical protein